MTDEQNQNAQPDAEQPAVEPIAVKKSNVVINCVEGAVIQLNQSSVNQVTGETVTVRESTVRQATGQSIDISNSNVAVAQGSSLTMNGGGIGICSVADASVNGDVAVMIGQSVNLTDHRTGLVVTREVHGGHIKSVIFLAGQSYAPVDTIVDQRSVALFGIATGVAMGLVLGIFRLFKR